MSRTSWESVSDWYDQIVSKEGHFYHKELIFPALLSCFKEKNTSILDLGCGQGVLERQLPKEVEYLGIDSSASLIRAAEEKSKSQLHTFLVRDLTKPLKLKKKYTHAIFLLSLQNMADPAMAIRNAKENLADGGKLYLIINHPCFRIPRQSSWGVEEAKKLQYRRIDRYMSEMEIPIQQKPSKGKKSETTFSYHHPLSTFVKILSENGLAITNLQELCSPKQSQGGKSKMENRARKEFPLFMLIEAK